jgi:hypothetical protein
LRRAVGTPLGDSPFPPMVCAEAPDVLTASPGEANK